MTHHVITDDIKEGGLKPLLKMAGGKHWLTPYLLLLWKNNQHRRLVEPFCGGLSVALGLNPNRALLNDINPHLINFYKKIQIGLLTTDLNMINNEDLYYAYRNSFNELVSLGEGNSSQAALLFYYLNHTGFNGLCRFNRKGEFNVPFGRYSSIKYIVNFSNYISTFSRWAFTSMDFESVPINSGDFIYADPPYDVSFTSYSKEGFDWDDQIRLAEWLNRHHGPIVVSGHATNRIVKLYSRLGFSISFIKAPRRIAANGNRKPVSEMLAMRGI